MAADPWKLASTGPENYERYQVPSVLEPLARIFLEKFPLKSGQRVLDVACGTGIVARLAAAAVGPIGQVVAVDLNDNMLEVARRKSAEAGVLIEWRQGEAGSLPCADGSFDVVLCQQGLQFFADRLGALKEMRRVMARDGRLGLSVWRSADHSPCHTAIAQALESRLGPEVVKRFLAIFSFGDEHALRQVVEQAGFAKPSITTHVLRRYLLTPAQSVPGLLASTPVGADVAALPPEIREAIVEEMARKLQGHREGDGLRVPQAAHIVTAQKGRTVFGSAQSGQKTVKTAKR